ncbi:MAG TPA: glycosyltransferase family A protein [Solirubrobacterales bacterium]|nr:glycosyltransferase family A protein [Solirubrobacterales bacterium]
MGQLVEVLAVDVDEVGADSPLLGANVDSPTAGRRMAASGLEISGWALASSGRPAIVEAALDGEALAQGIWHPREDLATAFPEVEGATAAGFELAADVSRVPEQAELEVAVEVEGARLPIARLRLRRYWRGELEVGRPPLVSIAVLDEGGGGEALERTLASVGQQPHPATEVLVLRPATAEPVSRPAWEENGIREVVAGLNGPALRNEGIRQSNGELILFLAAGSLLAPDALPLAVEMLTRKPAASAVIDGDRGGVAAAVYRRSAFEELEGFDEGGNDCDLALAIRAERRGALFAQGVLVPAGG